MAQFTTEQILNILDAATAASEFPMLDNGYVYPIDVRLSAYADNERWAILIEVLGIMPRAGDVDNTIYRFGNCLVSTANKENWSSPEAYEKWKKEHEFWDMSNVFPVDATGLFFEEDDDGENEEDDICDECDLQISPKATKFLIRNRTVQIPAIDDYHKKGVELQHSPHVQYHELMRCVAPEHRDLLVATEEELRKLIPEDLPLLLRLDEWWHPDTCNEELPSQTDTFQMIADVLVSNDPSRYKTPIETNTHWSNWPDGGTL